MPIAQIVWFGVKQFFDFFRQCINESAWRKANVNLVFVFLSRSRGTADLQHLTLFATGRIRPTGGLVVLSEQRDRAARLGQTVGMQIAAVVRHELLNARRGHLRDQVADFLIVPACAQRFHNLPMVAFFL